MKKTKGNAADTSLQEVLNRLSSAKLRSLDTETSGLDWRRHAIVGYVLAFSGKPQDSYYVPFRHAGKANVGGREGLKTAEGWDGKLAPGEKELLAAIDKQNTLNFGHNLNFDLKFMWRHGVRAFDARYEDTQINEPLIDEYAGKFSLAACAMRHEVQAKKGEAIVAYIRSKFPEATEKDAMGHFWRLPGDDKMAVEYARGDGTTTWQLRESQMREIVKVPEDGAPSLELVHDIESRLIPILARMSATGIEIDLERAEKLRHHLDREIDRMLDAFPSGFNVAAPTELHKLFSDAGYSDWPLTPKTQKPSFPEKYLETNELGRKIIAVRKLTHLKQSFIVPLLDVHLFNGRVHTNFNQLRNDQYGTLTGRLSSDSPNLQQVHKRNEELGRLFRGLFIPPKGKIWGSVDYSQCEPRLLAEYSNCKTLVDGYNAVPSIDAHTAVAKSCNQDKWDPSDPDAKGPNKGFRETGKRINQTLVTGGGKGVLVSKYGVPQNEVDKIWNDYFRANPEIKKLQKSATFAMRRYGYVYSLLGRRSQCPPDGRDYVGLNRLLQCGNADILKAKMVEIDDHLRSVGRPIDLVLNCHDAFDFHFDEAHRPVYNHCLEIMTDFKSADTPIKLERVPMEVDAGEGPDWAIATWGPEKKK